MALRHSVMPVTETRSIVRYRIQPGKQHRCETKFCKIANPHRVELAKQMITFVLHHAGVKPLRFAIDGEAMLIKAGIPDV